MVSGGGAGQPAFEQGKARDGEVGRWRRFGEKSAERAGVAAKSGEGDMRHERTGVGGNGGAGEREVDLVVERGQRGGRFDADPQRVRAAAEAK